jgi:RimJ/RimL family protein N-acetyltransferase
MTIKIAPMKAEFVEGFRRAVDIVARERKYLTFLEAPELPAMRSFVSRLLADGDAQFVALADGEVIGWCDIVRHGRPTHSHRGTLGMGILPAHRSRGVGRLLIEATLAKARENGLTRVELSVHADNARAIALYERVGFVAEGAVRDAICIDGEYRDAISMAIIFRDRSVAGGVKASGSQRP